MQLLSEHYALLGSFLENNHRNSLIIGVMKRESNDIIMTRRELARYFHISPDTVTRWTHQGLPVIYIGRIKSIAKGARPRYRLAQVLTWIENQQKEIE